MIEPAVLAAGRGAASDLGRSYFFDITGAESGWQVLRSEMPMLSLSSTVSGVGAGGTS